MNRDFDIQKLRELGLDEWQILGRYYGYPQCCIDNFCQMDLAGRTPEQLQFVRNGFGFVPCPVHAEQLVSGKLKIEDVIKNRFFPKPFPQQMTYNEMSDLLEQKNNHNGS